ncbi:hypothetical protein Aduo_010581 [Ancylostoma duodenale]
MDKRRFLHQHQDQSRPDRSRSPLQRKYPWDSNGEPKSVLYSVEVQFHRSPNKYTQCHRSPSKPSSSKPHLKCSSSTAPKAPLKELSQANRSRTSAHPRAHDSDASVQRLVEKLQRWTSRYSPPKFMAGMMPTEGVYDLPQEATPKRPSHGPWFVEYFSKSDDVAQQQKSSKESHPSRENIIRIEKENRRTDEFLASRNRADRTPFPQQKVYSRPHLSAQRASNDIEASENGHASPSAERRCGPVTPLNRKFEAASFQTPAGVISPNEEFFTPMTHLRPKEEKERSVEASYLRPNPRFTHDRPRSRFALINENEPSPSRISTHDTTIKERIERQLAAYDRVSSKLDISLREANDLLNRPMKLGLPSLTANLNLPAFGNDRQTIDASHLERLRSESTDDDRSPRRSLPLKTSEERASNGLSRTFVVAQDERANTGGGSAVSFVPEMPSNSQLRKCDVSLPKALGASMAAELAYAEKAQRVRTHLNATRRLAGDLGGKPDHYSIQKQDNDDIDRILDSISLRDESLLTYDQHQDESMKHGSPKPLQAASHSNPKVTTILGRKMLVLSAEEREERKKKVGEYLRMCSVLRSLQHAVYKLKRRLTSTAEQLAKIDELSKAADADYRGAVVEAKSWLSSRITYSEFSLLVVQRKKKVYMDSEDCSNSIKQLLAAQVARTRSTDETFLNPPAASVNELSPVRMDTRALNESVECDLWNLSARSLRRNLEARREQAEMLNRSFEERTKDIEQRTKESIAAQIVKYDHVIAERTNLLSRLDEISSEENPVLQSTPTPRRAGVEPLDLSQLSPEQNAPVNEKNGNSTALPLEGNPNSQLGEDSQSHVDQDHADVGISRAYSQSTVYEDSLSHFDEEEESRSGSACSEATLYQSDLENEPPGTSQSAQQHAHPSRRTLDTAEALTMLSRQVVTIISDETPRDEVDRILERIVEENVQLKVATATKDTVVFDGINDEGAQDAEASVARNTIAEHEPHSMDIQGIENDVKFKAEAVGNLEEAGDTARSPYESTRVDVSMTKSPEVEDGTEQCFPDKNTAPSDGLVVTINIDKDERNDQEEKLQDKFVTILDNKECGDFGNAPLENAEATSVLSPVQKSTEEMITKEDDTLFEETFDTQKESGGEWLSEDEDSSSISKKSQESNGAEAVADAEKHEEVTAQRSEQISTGSDTDGRDGTSEKFTNSGPQLSGAAEELNLTSESGAFELASTSKALTGDQIVNEAATEVLAVSSAENKLRPEEKRDPDSYELSFLDRVPDRTVDGRVSLGLNRSELCDSLSTSIMQLMTDSPRRRSLPRSYNLSDSLLEDSVALLATKSPRAAKERFNTKMPSPFSPRLQMLLENSLDTSISNVLADEAVKNVFSGDVLSELDKEVEGLSARVDRHAAGSTASPRQSEQNSAPPVSSQNLFEQLDETYEDLLSIEKCIQLVGPIWSKIRTQGFVRPLTDEFLPVPEVVDDVVAENEDERFLKENRTFMVWVAIVEVAAKLWPESYRGSGHICSKLVPIPKTREEFTVKAEQHVLEQLSEMPPSHRYSRLSRPPPPPYVDTAVDRSVARRFYEEDPYSFARKGNAEYRKLCEELIDRVGDRFLTTELQRMHQRLVASGDDATLLTPSATSSEQLSGEFGRPSLARLSMGSDVSTGRCSHTISSPLRVVRDGQQE